MKSFYTNVIRYGNSILYRGYKDGVPIKKNIRNFKPNLFVATDKQTPFKSIHGKPLGIVEFSNMADAKEFYDMNPQQVYGNTNFVSQFILDQHSPFKSIEFDETLLNITAIDIETYSADGFPEPSKAAYPITAITIKNINDTLYHTWGLGQYDVAAREDKTIDVVYHRFASEKEMLIDFIQHFSNHAPDILTGWNSRFFDIPYIVNRCASIVGQKITNKLSPWNRINARSLNVNGRKQDYYEIVGIAELDYLEIFKKFTSNTLGPQESYKLDHVAHVVLNERKLSYSDYLNLHDLYVKNYQKYIDYNIKDVKLIQQLDEKLGLLSLVLTMAYKAGVNYDATLGTTAIWDSIIYRFLAKDNIVIPPTRYQSRGSFAGGFVKEPQIGLHEWVMSYDLNSLYPSIMMALNISPEMLQEQKLEVSIQSILKNEQNLPKDYDYAIAANGAIFSKQEQGFIPKLIDLYYSERKQIKKTMLELKKEKVANQENSDELDKAISIANNQQMAVKILMNSLYGAMGSPYFRYFDLDMAAAITHTGQLVIQWGEVIANRRLRMILEDTVDRVITADTDSLYINFSDIVKRFIKTTDVNKVTDKLNQISLDIIEPALEKGYRELSELLSAYNKDVFVMKRENIADKAVFLAKKRYIMNVIDSEGVRYAEPKLKIMGIEAIKSSTPEICRDKFKEVFKLIVKGHESSVQDYIAKFKESFFSESIENISFPRSVGKLKEYMDNSKSGYMKGTPINTRAAIVYNAFLKKHNLTAYEPIKAGDKIKFCYLKKQNPLIENVVGFPVFLPKEFKIDSYIDYELMFMKTFGDPIESILRAIGWSLEKKIDLFSFC